VNFVPVVLQVLTSVGQGETMRNFCPGGQDVFRRQFQVVTVSWSSLDRGPVSQSDCYALIRREQSAAFATSNEAGTPSR